jgi:hypothetical protein
VLCTRAMTEEAVRPRGHFNLVPVSRATFT